MDRGTWWAIVHGVAKESGMTERLNNNKMLQQSLIENKGQKKNVNLFLISLSSFSQDC